MEPEPEGRLAETPSEPWDLPVAGWRLAARARPGRRLADALDDPELAGWTTAAERRRLLESSAFLIAWRAAVRAEPETAERPGERWSAGG